MSSQGSKPLKRGLWRFDKILSFYLVTEDDRILERWRFNIGKARIREAVKDHYDGRFGSSNKFYYLMEILNTYTGEHYFREKYVIYVDRETGYVKLNRSNRKHPAPKL